MYKTLSGKECSEKLYSEIKLRLSKSKSRPKLAIVLIGSFGPSEVYVRKKQETAAKLGIDSELIRLPENVSEKELLDLIKKLNNDHSIHGFIVQAPLPKHIDTNKVLHAVSAEKDVDGFHPVNVGKILLQTDEESMFAPATPAGVMYMLKYYKVPVAGKHAVVVGRSNIVGKPVAAMLLNADATVTICHSRTANLAEYTKKADVLVVAVGKPNLITAEMVKEGAYVIDVGTNHVEVDGKKKLVGDVDFVRVIKKAHCSPVPGGVGLMTVAMLLYNVAKAADKH